MSAKCFKVTTDYNIILSISTRVLLGFRTPHECFFYTRAMARVRVRNRVRSIHRNTALAAPSSPAPSMKLHQGSLILLCIRECDVICREVDQLLLCVRNALKMNPACTLTTFYPCRLHTACSIAGDARKTNTN